MSYCCKRARARWLGRAPRLAVAAWLALTGSAVVSVTLAAWRGHQRLLVSLASSLAAAFRG